MTPQNQEALAPWLRYGLFGRLHQNLDIWEPLS